MGLFGKNHKATLEKAQDLWDDDRQEEAVALLEGVLPKLRPKSVATDALIVATLGVYLSDMGDPQRGLALLEEVPVDGKRLTDVQLICLSARCSCRAAAGDLDGAQRDLDTIYDKDPHHFSLLVAESALAKYGTAP